MPNYRTRLLSGVFVAAGLLAGGAHGAFAAEARAAEARAATTQTPGTAPGEWGMYGHGYDNTRFSPLTQITPKNVSGLKLLFSMQLGSLRSNESTPLVIGDTMYVSTSWGPKYVYALDARTGQIKWKYEPEMATDTLQYACCDVNNRGVTYAQGKLFVGRLDGKLVALDAKTGAEIWTADVVDYKQGSVITSPPLVVRNLVVTGFGGGEYGARGSLQAYDIETGKQVWKTYTVPGPGEPGNETWKGDSWQHGGGAPWLVGSYDPKTNLILWGTSNPSPWNSVVRSTGNGDYGAYSNLYTASTLAFDADTGAIKWHFQTTPEDAWDFDGVNELVLADLKINGHTVPAAMKADRNGFFYVLNRETGKMVSAEKYVPVTWASKIDADGKPVEDPAMRPGPDHPAKGICPNLIGGKNWQPMSYNPNTGYVYIPTNNVCMDWATSDVNYRKGVFYLGAEFPTHPGPGGYMGEIMAWDPVTQKKVWGVKEDLPFNGGTLSTAGGADVLRKHARRVQGARRQDRRRVVESQPRQRHRRRPDHLLGRWQAICRHRGGPHRGTPAFLGDVGKQMVAATPEGGALFVFSE